MAEIHPNVWLNNSNRVNYLNSHYVTPSDWSLDDLVKTMDTRTNADTSLSKQYEQLVKNYDDLLQKYSILQDKHIKLQDAYIKLANYVVGDEEEINKIKID